MEITFLGHASFKIRAKTESGSVVIITDPFDPEMVGLKFPKTIADLVTVSHEHQDHNWTLGVTGEQPTTPKILRGPGEYEIKGITILGINSWHDTSHGQERGENTVFVFDIEKVRVAHLGDLGHKFTDTQLAEIGNVDILIIPVGGFYTIDPKVAVEIVSQVEPKVIIPMHYQEAGLNPSVFEKLKPVTEFVNTSGLTPKSMSSYVVKEDSLPEEQELVILERKG